jgi:hypothetical protein
LGNVAGRSRTAVVTFERKRYEKAKMAEIHDAP